MHTESNPTAATGDLQGRIAAITELLASYRSDHIEGISQLAQLLGDLRLLEQAGLLTTYRDWSATHG